MNPVLRRAFAAYVERVETGVRAALALGERIDYWFTPAVGVFFHVRGEDAEVLGVLPAEIAVEVLMRARG